MSSTAERLSAVRWFQPRWLVVFAYVALIFTLSSQPGLHVPGEFALRDKLAHTLEYGGLGLPVYRAARGTWPATPAARRMLFAVLAIAALGALDEKLQSFIPGRDSTVYDWMADAFGGTLSQVVGLLLDRRRGRA